MRKTYFRLLGLVAGAAMLSSAAGMAMAETTEELDSTTGESAGVEVPIEVTIDGYGALSMTVVDDTVSLTETAGGATFREFTGTLGDVTVTDTRNEPDIDPDYVWYVLGQAADFEGDASQPDITVDHLGWIPAMVDDGGDGNVTEGPEVTTVMDGSTIYDRGLVDKELLFWALPGFSAGVNPEGEWVANAELALRVPFTTQAGTYTSDLTLTLFED